MSDAIKKLHDYLAKSPSVVYPEDVIEYLPAIEDENAKLRELVREMHATISDRNSWWDCTYKDTRRFADRMRELGIKGD